MLCFHDKPRERLCQAQTRLRPARFLSIMVLGDGEMKQIVERKRLGPVRGALLILGLVAVLVILNFLCGAFLARWIGYNPASLVFWILGGCIALWMLHAYVVKYVYEMDADVLRLSRSYGKRPRHIADIYLRQIRFVGDPEAAKKRFPRAKKLSATRGGVDIPVLAVVYRTADGEGLALLQANAELQAKLEEHARANRKK